MLRASLISIVLACVAWAAQSAYVASNHRQLGKTKVERLDLPLPERMNMQGFVTSGGQPLTDTHTVVFRLFDAAGGGTELWRDSLGVAFQAGLFSVDLGMPAGHFTPGARRWLEMRVDGQTMSPRVEVTSVAFAYRSIKSDTAEYARTTAPSQYADSAGGARRVGGLDLTGLDDRYVNEGQPNSITSLMVVDGTITRADVATGFKAPFSDTADYARAAPADSARVASNAHRLQTRDTTYFAKAAHTHAFVDSARIAAGSHKLQGKDTTGFVRTGQANSVTSAMVVADAIDSTKIRNGSIALADLSFTPGPGTVTSVGESTGVKCRPNPITSSGKVYFDQTWGDGRYVNEGQADAVSSTMIQNDAVTMPKIDQSGASSGQVVKWNGSDWAPGNDLVGVTSVGQATGIICTPNPIVSSGTVGFDATWGDNRYVNEGQMVSNSDMVDGFHASQAPTPNNILPLNQNKCFKLWTAAPEPTINGWNTATTSGCPGVYGQTSDPNWYGVYGYSLVGDGVRGDATSSGKAGVAGINTRTSGNRWGVYCHEGSLGGYAYVGCNWNGTNYKITGGGNVACVMPTREGKKILFAPECPEPYFEDFGSGRLVSGHAHIELDVLFRDCIKTDADRPMKVFVQLNDDCNGVYVKVGSSGFDVYELQGGKSDASFTYRVVANRGDTDYLRFPPGIEPQATSNPSETSGPGGEK